jgi:hypothetical protein
VSSKLVRISALRHESKTINCYQPPLNKIQGIHGTVKTERAQEIHGTLGRGFIKISRNFNRFYTYNSNMILHIKHSE